MLILLFSFNIMSSLPRGHANLLCAIPILIYVLPKQAQLCSFFYYLFFTFADIILDSCGRLIHECRRLCVCVPREGTASYFIFQDPVPHHVSVSAASIITSLGTVITECPGKENDHGRTTAMATSEISFFHECCGCIYSGWQRFKFFGINASWKERDRNLPSSCYSLKAQPFVLWLAHDSTQ